MKSRLHKLSAIMLLGLGSLAAGDDSAVQAPSDNLGQELLMVTNDLWFLLSGVTDKEDADAAAPRFLELVDKAAGISDRFFADSEDGQDVESIENVPYQRISEAYEDLYQEFDMLCQTQCYGSEALMEGFRRAVELGVFNDANMVEMETPRAPLTEAEIHDELVRYKRLVEPDRAVLQILRNVKDAGSAEKATSELVSMTERLKQLLPAASMVNHRYADVDRRSLQGAYDPIEPLLWGIRNEIVRIAAIPGYEDASFDAFSDALDRVFEKLGDTHSAWFNEVFDASFRTDLDNAMHENTNATTSN